MMTFIWVSFLVTAGIIAYVAASGLRKGDRAFRPIGWLLGVMALGTALFPALLPFLGVSIWAWSYGFFVSLLTISMAGLLVFNGRKKC